MPRDRCLLRSFAHFHSRKFSAERKICKMWLADTNFRLEKIWRWKCSTFNNDIFGKFSVRGDHPHSRQIGIASTNVILYNRIQFGMAASVCRKLVMIKKIEISYQENIVVYPLLVSLKTSYYVQNRLKSPREIRCTCSMRSNYWKARKYLFWIFGRGSWRGKMGTGIDLFLDWENGNLGCWDWDLATGNGKWSPQKLRPAFSDYACPRGMSDAQRNICLVSGIYFI
jgi:hypothetical protein